MRTYVHVALGELDHPHVEVEPDEDTGEPVATVRLDETTWIHGDLAVIRRWVDELQLRVATS